MAQESHSITNTGAYIVLHDEGNKIEYRNNFFTSLEEVYFNEKLLFSKRNFKQTSEINFKVEMNEYSIRLKTIHISNGPIVINFFKNGKAIATKQIELPHPGEIFKNMFWTIRLFVMYLALYHVYSWAKNHWDWPDESVWGIIPFIIFSLHFLSTSFQLAFAKISNLETAE